MSCSATDKVTVIRVIKYEGTEEAVRRAIAQSLPLGIKLLSDYRITVAEHLNELPPLVTIEEKRVDDLFKANAFMQESEASPLDGPTLQTLREQNPSYVRPKGCCCPPPGHTGIWSAAMCPVHQGLRRKLPSALDQAQRFALKQCRDE